MDLLLYIVMSGLLGLLASRAVSPIRRRDLAILILLPLVFFGSSLVGSNVLAPAQLIYQSSPFSAHAERLGVETKSSVASDLIAQMIPWKAASRASWFDGEPPLWNPYMLGGDALAPTVQPASYEPIFLSSLLLDLGPSLGYIAAMTIFLSLLGMFLLLRDLALGEVASLLGAVAWAFGSFSIFWVQWAIGLTTVFLPLVILGVRRAIRRPGWSAAMFLAIVFAWMLLSGHSETAIHHVYTGIAWSLWELARKRPSLEELWKIVATGVGAGVVSVLLTAFFLAPVVEILPETHEYNYRKLRSDEVRTAPAAVARYRLATPVIPYAWGYAGWSHPEEAPAFPLPDAAYPGSVALLLAFVGLVASRRKEKWWVLGLGGATLLISAEIPVAAHLIEILPGLEMSLNERFDVVTLFTLAILAAFGVEGLRELSTRRRLLIPSVGAVLLGVAALWGWSLMNERGVSAEMVSSVTIWFVLPLALSLIVVLVGSRRAPAAAVILLALLVVQRAGEASWFHSTVTPGQFYPTLPILEAVEDSGEPFRIVGVGDALLPATATMYGLEDVRGYQALSLERYRVSFLIWAVHQPVWFNRVDDLTRPFLSALNVRYAFAPPGYGSVEGWRRVFEDESGVLLENERFLSRAWVPDRVALNMTNDQLGVQMPAAEDFGVQSWVHHPSGGAEPDLIENGPGTVVEVVATSVRRRKMTVEMEGPGWVVVSEPAWPGWKAFENGERLPLRWANFTQLALHLEPGRHEIELVYLPRSFVVGSWISGLTLAASLLGFGALRFFRRRRAAVAAAQGC